MAKAVESDVEPRAYTSVWSRPSRATPQAPPAVSAHVVVKMTMMLLLQLTGAEEPPPPPCSMRRRAADAHETGCLTTTDSAALTLLVAKCGQLAPAGCAEEGERGAQGAGRARVERGI